MPKNFALLVGNGFTTDLINSKGLKLNSSLPLKNFNDLHINYSGFIDYIPAIKDELFGQDIDDYIAISQYATKYALGSSEEGQLRRFLAQSYSMLQLTIDEYNLFDWKWVQWLQKNRKRLGCVISFNYDVLLERSLKFSGIAYSRIGTDEPIRKVPVLKPHGSIDFDISNNFFGGVSVCENPEFFWKNLHTSLNDMGSVEIVPKSKWLCPRIQADIIPPSRDNYQRNLSWVNLMFRTYTHLSSQLDALVIVGSSYWDVDRPEINHFLEKLPKTAIVYIANLKPDEYLLEKLTSLGLSFQTFGFDELPW